MRTIELKPSTIVACMKCKTTTTIAKGVDWNIDFRKGVIIGFLCPDCQTPEQNAEAEIRAATTDYSQDAFGRVIGRAKAVQS